MEKYSNEEKKRKVMEQMKEPVDITKIIFPLSTSFHANKREEIMPKAKN